MAQSAAHHLSVTEDRNGGSVEIMVGEFLVLDLPVQMGTGFSWQLVPGWGEILSFAGQSVQIAGGTGLPGSAERQIFRFTAAAPGETDLRLDYRQPWQPDRVEKTFRLTVKAR